MSTLGVFTKNWSVYKTDTSNKDIFFCKGCTVNEQGDELRLTRPSSSSGGTQTTPATINGTSSTSVTVDAAKDMEYSIDGTTWQRAGEGEATVTFDGLTLSTEYQLRARKVSTSSPVAITRVTTKAAQDAPAAPEVRESTADSITVETTEGMEYSIDGGTTWQTSGTFTGLKADTEYTVLCRRAATDVSDASPASSVLTVKTEKGSAEPQPEPAPENPTYDILNEEQKKSADDLVKALKVNQDTAAQMILEAEKLGVSLDTVKLDTAAILALKDDSDPKGSSFGGLTASAAKRTKSAITLQWKKNKKADGYLIFGNLCGKKYKLLETIQKNSATSFTQKKLKKGKEYKYLVVAYKNINGQKMTIGASVVVFAPTKGGKTTVAKSVKVTQKKKKKDVAVKKLTLKKGKSVTIKATENKKEKKLKVKTHRKVKFESSDPKVAKVNKNGKVTGVKKGKATVYAYAQNGLYKKIQVTVK